MVAGSVENDAVADRVLAVEAIEDGNIADGATANGAMAVEAVRMMQWLTE